MTKWCLPVTIAFLLLSIACQQHGAQPTEIQPSSNPVSPAQGIPFGEEVTISCNCPCWFCAREEIEACLFLATTVPSAGMLSIRMEFDTDAWMSISLLDQTVSGNSPLVIRQNVESGEVRFSVACNGGGRQRDIRMIATLE